ncbi:MAG: Ig-like domain-containing protein [Terracidiphilus sp.]|jgi:hypothetical protein
MFNRGYYPFAAAALVLTACSGLCRAQQDTQQPVKSEIREAWRKSMVNIPLPKKGCFTASYPSTGWQEVPCSTAKPFPPQPAPNGGKRGGAPQVGNGGTADFSAETTGLYTSAEGTFNSVTPGITEAAGPTGGSSGTQTNSFSLQLNTNTFSNTLTTSLCRNAATPSLCRGWEQFVFQNNLGPGTCGSCVSVWYWLVPYGGATCPTGWTPDVGDCFISSTLVTVPTLTITPLPTLTLTGKISGGIDTVILDNNTSLSATTADSTLDLDLSWNQTEFNVFGGGGGDEAFFSELTATNPGTTIVVKTSVVDGTMNPPTCSNASFTGETNSLNLVTCCPYGGTSPNIQFMESNAGHTASCGPTQLLGDPHITTADGSLYNFQGAGEFVSLRDSDGAEVQTRQKPVPTTFIGFDSYDGLTTCVSLNTAVAARVGEHRVTWEPNLSGVPDPSGLQLRIDGALTTLPPQGVALGAGGRATFLAGDALEVDFPDGKSLLATPEWWPSQSEWYLNVDVSNLGLVSADTASSGRGIAGAIASGSWLPALPNGASLGPMPPTLPERYDTLYNKFADAWRVNSRDSLFDYAPGTSTETFTNKDWPKEQPPCVVGDQKPLEPGTEDFAQAACRRVSDQNARADCIFDVHVTGDPIFAHTYAVTQHILADATTTSLTSDADPSQAGEWVAFTAVVFANSKTTPGVPSGTVQFAVDGANAGAPVSVDAKGRAIWETAQLKVGTHKVTASYIPGPDSVFLPSTSLEKLQTVKRCFCDAEHDRK